MTARAFRAVYRSQVGPRVLVDVDLGFSRWRIAVQAKVPRGKAGKQLVAGLVPGAAVDYRDGFIGPSSSPAFAYPATVRRVIDGDTIEADLDAGLGEQWRTQSVRLLGVNAIEIGQPGGREAAANLTAVIARSGNAVTLRTAKPDKYGQRVDALVELLADGSDLSALLVAAGWAAAWDGRGVRPVPAWPRPSSA